MSFHNHDEEIIKTLRQQTEADKKQQKPTGKVAGIVIKALESYLASGAYNSEEEKELNELIKKLKP